ncbi:MAG: hypothetical protein JW982_11600 [Spirochaetes bacterium]|nr:hypothetical protein [Spirochaetota bacterium]
MKSHILLILLILFILTASNLSVLALTGESADNSVSEQTFNPESAIRSDTDLVIISENIKILMQSFSAVNAGMLSSETRLKFTGNLKSFEKSTSYNLLSLSDLEKIGLDTDKRFFAQINFNQGADPEISFFLPVSSARNYPLKFVKILKQSPGFMYRHENPVVSSYKNTTIYQMGRDNFFCMKGDFLFLTMSYNSLISIIDTAENDKSSLIKDRDYLKIKGKYLQSKENIFLWYNDNAVHSILKNSVPSLSKYIQTDSCKAAGFNVSDKQFSFSNYFSPGAETVAELKKVFLPLSGNTTLLNSDISATGFLNVDSIRLFDYLSRHQDDKIPAAVKKYFPDYTADSAKDTGKLSDVVFASIVSENSTEKIRFIRYDAVALKNAESFYKKIKKNEKPERDFIYKDDETGIEFIRISKHASSAIYLFFYKDSVFFSDSKEISAIINYKLNRGNLRDFENKTGYKISQNAFLLYFFNDSSIDIGTFFMQQNSFIFNAFSGCREGILTGEFDSDLICFKFRALLK